MAEINSPSEEVLKQAIFDLKEPVLFQRMLQDATGAYTWKLLNWNLSELAKKFGDSKLPFRVGYNAKSKYPQWEVNCPMISMTLSDFIRNVDLNENDKKWYYFDYKYMHEWFKDNPEVIDSLSWKRFGFDKSGSESTLWIGNKGAHTNCHQDSYGCNLVAQIHGRKQWLLFPPSSSNFLHPTRIPYEESTVYSKYNFFSPSKEDEVEILKVQQAPKLITLEPGDVLLVPAGWWHYVESLNFSISVNTWLPIITDNISRVKEAIVKLVVARIGKDVYNTSDDAHCNLSYYVKLLRVALNECKNVESMEQSCKKTKHTTWIAEDLQAQYPAYVKLLSELKTTELEEFLKTKRERFSENITELQGHSSESDNNIQNTFPSCEPLSEDIVNAFCHPDVVNKVADLLLSL
ncbi:HSPB1-associated protein 1 isoform X1 [Hylaeus volcanicus]|uniref:HSPB1-associated protein 1 isoform X1 n=2 Tax=Hylaeus volcanicus TaxID=313075 RepID=UPI0023B85C89|nr:HSPB1-associated protein 1 isoform X1 [Hylaeus volcanicus]